MLVLLPPSETKRFGGRQQFAYTQLSRDSQLEEVRKRVSEALISVSRDEAAAVKALKLGVKNREEREFNLRLDSSGAMAAIERYTGVLYDAIQIESLDDGARSWIDAHVAVQSALFGLCHADDLIPAYRLSASSRLPKLGAALAKVWAPVHAGVLAGSSYVLDLRSKDYAALAPLHALGALDCDFVEVVTRAHGGEMRALNHFNKTAKGELVRQLAISAPSIENRADLLEWAAENGFEMTAGADPHTLRLISTHTAAHGTARGASQTAAHNAVAASR
ncbi:MAG: YaaA family protein [Leucobacter sp.]